METKILTPKGFKLIGDVKVGDQVCNPDGTVSRVIGVRDQGPQQFYRVTLADGSSVEASEGHLWAVSVVGGRRRRKHTVSNVPAGLRAEDEWNLRLAQRYTIVTTRDLVELVGRADAERTAGKMPRHVLLPLTAPVILTGPAGRWPTLPPYTLGALIGDGHLGKDAVTITCADEGIVGRLREELGDTLRVVPICSRGAATAYRISNVPGRNPGSSQELLRRDGLLGCLSYEKFVPERIKRAPADIRFAFIQGLFDTDGHMDERGHIEITTVSESLAKGVQWLLRSLGYRAKITTKQPTFTHKGEKKQGRLAYRLHVRGPHQERLFGLPRKVGRAARFNGRDVWPGHRIISVVPTVIDNARCITVDHPNGLYVTDDFIVTHNSHWGIAQVITDDCRRFDGLKYLYLRKVGKAGREAVQDLRREVLHSTPHEYKASEGIIVLPNGSRVVLGHFQNDRDIDNYLGLQYDGALIEEATQLTSRKIRDIATCVRSAKPGWRPRMYFTTNPGNIGHAWFKDLFLKPHRAGRETLTRFIPATVRDNRFVNPEYRAELESLTGWQRRAWLDGDWDIAAGQFFTTFRRDVHILASPPEVLEGWRVWLGFDYGFTHYTAAHLFAESGDGILYAVAEHGERRWLPERHAAAIHAMIGRHGVAPHRLQGVYAGSDVFAKKQSGGTVADDYRGNKDHPLRLQPANMDRINGAAEILRRLGDPEAGIEPTLFLSPACARLAESLPTLEHDPHRPEDVLKVDCDDDGLGGDDFYDCARYSIMAASRPKQKVYRFGG